MGINPDATGYRNIELLGLIAGYSKKEIKKLSPQIEEFSELGEYLHLPVRTYSNGMAMRLKFSCGTAFAPEILLMDEWLGTGDPEFKLKARQHMSEIVNEAGILVLATHNKKHIREECNKLLWLHKGMMRALGPTEEIFEMMEKAENGPWVGGKKSKSKLEKDKAGKRRDRKRQKQKRAAAKATSSNKSAKRRGSSKRLKSRAK